MKAEWVSLWGTNTDRLFVGDSACADVWIGEAPEDTEHPDGAWVWRICDEQSGIPWVIVDGLPLSGHACSEERARESAIDAVRARLEAALAALDGAQ